MPIATYFKFSQEHAGVATRAEQGVILKEFAEIAGYHRKHAERLLRARHP